MEIKHRKRIGWRLLLIVLAVLLSVSTPATLVSAAPPSSGTLTIHKYALEDMDSAGLPNDGNAASVPAGAIPLSGVGFSVWKVDPAVAAGMTSLDLAWQNILPATKQDGTTGANGAVTFSLGRGLYYVAETADGGNTSVILSEPFLVIVPMENPAGTGWITDVHVYPKNQSLAIDKFVGAAGDTDYDFVNFNASKHRPVEIGERFGWSILSALPANMGTADTETYTVTDRLSDHFDYMGNLKVYAASSKITAAGSAFLLTKDVDYIFSYTAGTNTLTVELTASGITRLGDRYTTNGDRYLLMKYDCALNSIAKHGVNLYSGAAVEYTRNTGATAPISASAAQSGSAGVQTMELPGSYNVTMLETAGTSTTATATVAAEPEVHTGQIEIVALADGTKKPLAGVQFGLALSEADAKAGIFIATGVTDDNGVLTFESLRYGLPGDQANENSGNTVFWLAEIKEPGGYRPLNAPVRVTFNYQQDADTGEYYFARVTVVYNLVTNPLTAGSATRTGDSGTLYLYGAVMLLSLAAIAFVLYRMRKKKASVIDHN